MKYLKRFWTILIDFFPKKSDVPKKVGDQEILTRYITSKRWFSSVKEKVKPQAYMPPPDLKLSIFRITNLSNPEIWKIGFNQVIKRMKESKKLYGRADIKAKNVFEADLQIDPDDTPPRHANIVNWPKQKEEIKSIAQELAAEASLNLHNS